MVYRDNMEALDRSYAKSILILLLSNNGKAIKSDFSVIASSWKTLSDVISALEEEGFLTISEQVLGRKTYVIEITDKGREVAEKLKQAQDAAEGKQPTEPDNEKQENSNPEPTEGVIHLGGEDIDIKLTPEERENSKYLKFLFHFNVMDNHITVEEAVPGKRSRIFNIYVKQNGHGIFRLWCEADDSYECWHVREAWTYPQVQKMMTQYKGKVKVCQVCGSENPERAKFCMECGAKLE